MNKRNFALLTGYSLALMALVAGFSLGFAFPKMFNADQADLAQNTLSANLQLYQWMLLGLLIILLLDVFVSWTSYEYFKNDNQILALASAFLRIIYSVIFGISIYFLSKNIGQPDNTIVLENYNYFQKIWSVGLIVFGGHLLTLGILMKLHQRVPKFLWYLTLVAGASYVLIHLLKTAFPQLTELSNTLNNVLGLPMALGELGLAVWLIIKGGKAP